MFFLDCFFYVFFAKKKPKKTELPKKTVFYCFFWNDFLSLYNVNLMFKTHLKHLEDLYGAICNVENIFET